MKMQYALLDKDGNVKIECPKCGKVKPTLEINEDYILEQGIITQQISPDTDIIRISPVVPVICCDCHDVLMKFGQMLTVEALETY